MLQTSSRAQSKLRVRYIIMYWPKLSACGFWWSYTRNGYLRKPSRKCWSGSFVACLPQDTWFFQWRPIISIRMFASSTALSGSTATATCSFLRELHFIAYVHSTDKLSMLRSLRSRCLHLLCVRCVRWSEHQIRLLTVGQTTYNVMLVSKYHYLCIVFISNEWNKCFLMFVCCNINIVSIW